MDAASPALLEAWSAAYGQLANLMIGVEADLYAAQIEKPGGWTGWRPFEVRIRTTSTDKATTFHLYPFDGGPVAMHVTGQYLSVRLFMPHLNLLQPHQYRITNEPNGASYSISGKYETEEDPSPTRMICNRLLGFVHPGDRLDVSAPVGAGTIKANTGHPTSTSGKAVCPMAKLV